MQGQQFGASMTKTIQIGKRLQFFGWKSKKRWIIPRSNIQVLYNIFHDIITTKFGLVDSLKAGWRNLRNYFFKKAGRIEKVTGEGAEDDELPQNWEFFEALSFLLEQNRYSDSRLHYNLIICYHESKLHLVLGFQM